MTRKHSSPEFLADRLRRKFWGTARIPVDPVTIALRLGIRPVEATLPDGAASALIKKPGSDPFILVDERDSDVRKRYAVAYELGHYVRLEQDGAGQQPYTHVELREPAPDPREGAVFATDFAGELLAPEAEMQALDDEGYDAVLLAAHFGIPVDVINRRFVRVYEAA